MRKSGKNLVLLWKTGRLATIVLIILLAVAGGLGPLAAATGQPGGDSSCSLRIIYGGSLRSSIEPCG